MQIKVFIPSFRDGNPYLEEIINYSQCKFIFSPYKNYRSEYDFVNIHWPESLFGWREPSPNDLAELKTEIKKWKRHSKLIYTFHDERHHFGMTTIYKQLFDLVENSADIFIHLGEYSNNLLAEKFPDAIHKTISHPLYLNSFKIRDKKIARGHLGIDSDALVVMAAGRIRNLKERKLLLSAFRSISVKNKVLISNNMLPFSVQPDFKGRVILKKIFHLNEFKKRRMFEELRPPKYLFNFGFTDTEEISNMASASDIIFIPRINTLNSGNVFLGLTYKKVIVGPAIGNIQEVLEKVGFPVFEPGSLRSVKGAMEDGVDKFKNGFSFPANILQDYHPKTVAGEMDQFLRKLE